MTTMLRTLSALAGLLVWMAGPGARAELPDFPFALSRDENPIDGDNHRLLEGYDAQGNPKPGSTGLSANGGGLLLNGFSASLGQAFDGGAYQSEAILAVAKKAQEDYDQGGAKLSNKDNLSDLETKQFETIFKKGIVFDTHTLDGHYNDDQLIAAEADYRRLLRLDPGNRGYAEQILRIRHARVLKGNLVSDINLKRRFARRYEDTGANDDILRAEKAYLWGVATLQRANLALLTELFADPLPNGPGALVRREAGLTPTNATLLPTHFRLIYASGYRYARIMHDLGKLILETNLLTNDSGTQENNRDYALTLLGEAHDYLGNLLQLVNPWVSAEELARTDAYRLTALQSRLKGLMTQTQLGFNTYGFLPEFVPYIQADAHDKNLYTFDKLLGLARDSQGLAAAQEELVKTTYKEEIQGFAQTDADFKLRAQETELSYTQRLMSLAGVYSDGTTDYPDVLTAGSPDLDLDGDGVTERDALRAQLKAKDNRLVFKAKGQVAEQYQVMANTKDRIQQTLNNMAGNLASIADQEQRCAEETKINVDANTNIVQIIYETGDKVGALIEQRGRLLQKKEEDEKKKARDNGILSGVTQIAFAAAAVALAAPTGGASFAAYATAMGPGLANATSAYMSASSASIQQELAGIERQMEHANRVERATISTIQMDAENQKRVVDKVLNIRALVRAQENLALDVEMARRDYAKEQLNLANRLQEIATLAADAARMNALYTQRINNFSLGWDDPDVRDVLNGRIEKADQALDSAKAWSYVAFQSLAYYANKPPQPATGEHPGQMDERLWDMFSDLYRTRKATVLGQVQERANKLAVTDFLFSGGSLTCQGQARLSLKYDIFARAAAQYDADGNPLNISGEGDFRYQDLRTGNVYTGAQGYQALFRDRLREAYTHDANGNGLLRLTFGTDHIQGSVYNGGSTRNPFFKMAAVNAKITGFNNGNCGASDAQGVSVNLTGGLGVTPPNLVLRQTGNAYIKHTGWKSTDFKNGRLAVDPLASMTAYSSYCQTFPNWMIGDIDAQMARTPALQALAQAEQAVCEGADQIGDDVKGFVYPYLNGQKPFEGAAKTLSFTDRSVANDRWELEINQTEAPAFFQKLDAMLAADVPANPSTDFLTDIQLLVGWAHK